MEGRLAPGQEEVELNWCGEEFWWGQRTLPWWREFKEGFGEYV